MLQFQKLFVFSLALVFYIWMSNCRMEIHWSCRHRQRLWSNSLWINMFSCIKPLIIVMAYVSEYLSRTDCCHCNVFIRHVHMQVSSCNLYQPLYLSLIKKNIWTVDVVNNTKIHKSKTWKENNSHRWETLRYC